MSEQLADELQRLCCAETEGKFFDCVTDNITEIIAALRSRDALVKALERINDPLNLPVEGVGTTRLLQTMNAMAMIAKDALASVGLQRNPSEGA